MPKAALRTSPGPAPGGQLSAPPATAAPLPPAKVNLDSQWHTTRNHTVRKLQLISSGNTRSYSVQAIL